MKDPAILFAREAQAECLRIADEIVDEIQASPLTHVITGRMLLGYQANEWNDGAEVSNPIAPYWVDEEYGHDTVSHGRTTGHRPPHAHVRPAIEVVRARNT
jgi:hypothetical protein